MPTRRHLAPGTADNAQPFLPVVIGFFLIEIREIAFQEYHAGNVFQQLCVCVLAQLPLGQDGFHLLAFFLWVATFLHDSGGPAAMHAATGLAPFVIGLATFREIATGDGPALDVLGAAGNLHAFGGLRLKLKQPAGHVLAVGVFLGQGYSANLLDVGVCTVGGIDSFKSTGQ